MSAPPLPNLIGCHNTPAPEPSPAGRARTLPMYPRHAYETSGSPGFLTARESTGDHLRSNDLGRARPLHPVIAPLRG